MATIMLSCSIYVPLSFHIQLLYLVNTIWIAYPSSVCIPLLSVQILASLLYLFVSSNPLHSTRTVLLFISVSLDFCSVSQSLHSVLLFVPWVPTIPLTPSTPPTLSPSTNVPISKPISIYLYLIICFVIRTPNLLEPNVDHE